MLQLENTCTIINRIKKRLILLILLILSFSSGFSQQNTLLTHYMFNNMAFNPAYAGNGAGICVNGLVREQWLGFKDEDGNKVAPETFLLTVDSPVRILHGGVGGSIVQDKLGFFTNLSVKLGYAYHASLGTGDLSIGLQLAFQNSKLDFTKFKPIDTDDELINGKGNESDMMFDFSAGLFYKIQDKFWVGLSGDNLLQTKGKNTYYQLKRHFYLASGYQWIIPNHPAFEIQPSVLFMFDGGVFQFNLSALLWYNNKFYGGLAYRYQDAVSILAGMTIKGFRVGLAYDISTSKLNKYNNGSIEVMLGYCFKIDTDKFRKSYRNTRFL